MSDTHKAFELAQEAAAIDFDSAVFGLLAGHAAHIKALTELVSRKDIALLASLAISGKGIRIGASDGLAQAVCDGLSRGSNAAPIERDFLARHTTTDA